MPAKQNAAAAIVGTVPVKAVPVGKVVAPYPAVKKAGTGEKPSHKPKRGAVLVPPPPPTIPAAVHIPFVSGVPVELMSEPDLKRHRDELAVHLAKANRQAADQEIAHKDRGDRAVLFESLYKEGVVSRRELENAQRDVRQGEEDLTDARLKVTDLELELKRTDARLKELGEQKRPRSISKTK